MANPDPRLEAASREVARVLGFAFKLYDEEGKPLPVQAGDPIPTIAALSVIRLLDAEADPPLTEFEKLLEETKAVRAEVDAQLKDAIDDCILTVNGLIVYGIVRWSVGRHGGPKWAGINLGRLSALVAMSPSRKPLAAKLRENVERTLKGRDA